MRDCVEPLSIKLPKRILVIDDSTAVASSIGIFLRGLGHNADVAFTKHAALYHLRCNDYALILVDLHLGDESGIDLMREAIKSGKNAQYVLMSSNLTDEAELFCATNGIKILEKPFKFEDLLKLVPAIFSKCGHLRHGN
jgi:DNA-binding response OmpR family regulator